MFVILTNFFVQLVVENLLKVLKTQVFYILYFLDYCLFARVCTFRARARIVIIDCLPYYSGSPPRRGARRKGGCKPILRPPFSIHDYVLAAACLVPLCWGTLALRGGSFNLLCMRQIVQICTFQFACLRSCLLLCQRFFWLLYQPFLQRLWLLYRLPQGLRLTC